MRLSEILQKKTHQTAAVVPAEPVKPEKPEPQTEIAEIRKLVSAEKVYGEAILAVKAVFSQAIGRESMHISPLLGVTKKIIALITAANDDLLSMCEHSTPDVYLYAHSVNVSILSVMLGSALDYTEQDLGKICICGFLHDVGMVRVFDISAKPDRLDHGDIIEIRKHAAYAPEILERLDTTREMKDLIIKISVQVHEREDGKGYPKGVSGEEINVFSKIIGLADVYEALTHQRTWRERVLPHNALKKMIEMADSSFETNMVKLFIEKLSLYPVGSYVRLNTGEIARVTGVNRGLPTRPIVKVFLSQELQKLSPETSTDLSKNSMIYITEPVDETKLNLKDKKLALELKARRWWVKGI